jgi:hypothetical protein
LFFGLYLRAENAERQISVIRAFHPTVASFGPFPAFLSFFRFVSVTKMFHPDFNLESILMNLHFGRKLFGKIRFYYYALIITLYVQKVILDFKVILKPKKT